jgi:hypothetical protein
MEFDASQNKFSSILVYECNSCWNISPVSIFPDEQNTNAAVERMYHVSAIAFQQGHPVILAYNERTDSKNHSQESTFAVKLTACCRSRVLMHKRPKNM